MKKIALLLIMSIFVYSSIQAQTCNAPVINSFTPNTGFIGSTVTITGANFDPIPANNQVYFGATQANIISASFGQLVVAVPTGANVAPIAVKNACNKIGYSSVAFNGIFCPTPLTSQTYQNVAFQLNGVYGAYNMMAQDFDMDGKPDVISMTNGGTTIAKNNSTPGTLSFSAVNYGWGGSSVAVADFDGDGKRDIRYPGAVARNTSTGPGNISFSSPVGAGPGGYQTAVGDFNNDGKVDVVVEQSGYVYVTLNTSTGPGNISFGTVTNIGYVGMTCTGMQASDVDGDGRTDVLGTQGNGNRAVTLRNTTTPGSGTVSFESPEYWNTNGQYPYRCMIADFNKDGKIDLTTCNYNGATNTAIFINNSTVGDISFNTSINLPSPQNNYRIGVGDVNGDGYPDIVTKSLGVNVFSVYPNTTTNAATTTFAARFDYSSSTQAEVSGIVIGDLDGDFVPDIATSGISSNNIRFHRNTSSQVDNQAPNAICKNITVALSPTGTATVTAAMIDNGSGDACGIGSLKIDGASSKTFTCNDIGANTVTLTVTDIAGNVSTCNAVVTVAPAAIIVAGQTTVCQGQTIPMSANLGDSYQWYKDGVTIDGATSQTYVATVSGAYTVSVTNAGGCSGISAATNVVVNNNPTVTTFPAGTASLCPPNGSLTITASTSSIYQWQKDGINIPNATQQALTVSTVGTYTVNVVDLFGCSATSAPIVVGSVDNVNPILVTNNVTVALDANESASVTLAELVNAYSDNCTNVTLSFSGQTSYSCSDVGNVIAISITATDGSGNTTTQLANVTVTDPNSYCNAAPVAVCQNLNVAANGITASVAASAFNGGSTDPDGDVMTFTVSPAGPYSLGTTDVVVTVSDPAGLFSTCNASITVVDSTKPTMSVKNDTIYVDANGNASITVADIDNGSTDNVGIVTLSLSQTDYNCSNLGLNTITLTATDAAGNVNTADATVSVLDIIAPTVSTVLDQEQCYNPTESYTIENVTAFDNCTIASVSYSITGATTRSGSGYDASGNFALGTSTITWTVTDNSNNASTSTATFTVNPLPVASVVSSDQNTFCNEVTLTASSSLGDNTTYMWSTGETTQSITLDADDADGSYFVYVISDKGCNSANPATYNYQKQNLVNSYSILAFDEVEMKGTNTVQTGSVGVMRLNGEAEFEKGVNITSPGSFTKSPKYKIKGTVTISSKLTGVANVTLPSVQSYSGSTNGLPSYTVNKNVTVTLNSNYKDLTIRRGANATIGGSTFRKVTIEEGATVRFTSSTVNIEDLKVGTSKSSSATRIRFAGNTNIRIRDKVSIEGNVILNQDNHIVTFHFAQQSSCGDNDEDKFSVKGGNTTIIANVLIPNGKIKVENEGDDDDGCHGNNNGGTSIYMTGLYVGNKVKSEGRNIYWNTYSCTAPSNRLAFEEPTEPTVYEELNTLLVYPNPAASTFNYKFETSNTESVSFRIFDTQGRLIHEILNANANEIYTIGDQFSPGVYVVEATQAEERKVVRVVKTK